MDNAMEIKLPIMLPKLDPQAQDTLMVAMEEMYRRGYADAKDNLCAGCGYKAYYSQVAVHETAAAQAETVRKIVEEAIYPAPPPETE